METVQAEEVVEGVPAFHAADRAAWRGWLAANSEQCSAVWLVLTKQSSALSSVGYAEAVEEALCFGWVDSKTLRRDDESRYQRFSPRNPKSTWVRSNRERAERMIAEGRMAPSGQAAIDLAKRTGTWDALAAAEDGVIPDDLQHALDANAAAAANFEGFSRSARVAILSWIETAKRPETRAKRIAETVDLAAEGKRAR